MAHATSFSTPTTRLDHGDDEREGAPDELTHLLRGGDEEALVNKQAPMAFPKVKIASLLAVRIADPIAYQQIFPYINQLLVDMGVAEPSRVGLYSGLVESTYSLAQVFSVYQWGRISDIVGRRPVMFITVVGIAATSTTFGLSTTFTGIVASRFFGGLVAGNTAVIHSIFAEITDDTNQDLAVPIYSLSWPLGTVLGPLIGGTLENAATRYPQYFHWDLFAQHPYLPPCIASAACSLVGVALGYIFIEETLPSKRKHVHRPGSHLPPVSERVNANLNEAEPADAVKLLSIPAIRALTISGFALSFVSLAFDVVFTLFCYTPVEIGGLGLNPSTIGNTLAFAGVITVLLRFSAMQYILHRFDYAKTYNACMNIWPFTFAFLPFLNLLARTYPPSGSTAGPASSVLMWASLFALLTLSKIGTIPYSLNMLLVKQHAPTPGSLGRSNGLVQFAMCTGRAVAPIAVSTLFTSTNGMVWAKQWGVGGLWAVVMVVAAVAGARVTRGLGSLSGGG